jgi:hypothetical protein
MLIKKQGGISMFQLKTDFTKNLGPMRPLHGIGNAPTLGNSDMLFHYVEEAGIPFSRLHDMGGMYGGARFVDIPNVFPNFDADPYDPASYDFAYTDWLLTRLHKMGVEIIYRLGVTIENYLDITIRHIYPPKDFKKWAVICEHIIRHYNEGWANGLHLNILRWEIWNEPENHPDLANNHMWQGTKEEYFELYRVTANHLKACFPALKVGGYGSCGFYTIGPDGKYDPNYPRARYHYFYEFFHDFMKYITAEETKAPLDFFSWHHYQNHTTVARYARYVRQQLDAYGFTEAESILDEWSPGPDTRDTPLDPPLIGAVLASLQDAPVDIANFYDGRAETSFGALFDPVHKTVFPTYYDFVAYNELYKLGSQTEASVDCEELVVLAAANEKEAAVLLVNPTAQNTKLTMDVSCDSWIIIDPQRIYQPAEIPADGLFRIPALSVSLFRFDKL